MRYRQSMLVSDEMMNDLYFVMEEVKGNVLEYDKIFSKQGLKRSGAIRLQAGKDNDGFMTNCTLIVIEGNVYKAPRICLKRDYKRKRFTLKMIMGKNFKRAKKWKKY